MIYLWQETFQSSTCNVYQLARAILHVKPIVFVFFTEKDSLHMRRQSFYMFKCIITVWYNLLLKWTKKFTIHMDFLGMAYDDVV